MNDRHLARLRSPELGLGLRSGLSGGGLFNPMIIFANGEMGVWFDPSDLATMFSNSTGSAAAAVDGTVGLHLDKSKALALGADLVTNGGFTTDTGWTKDTGWTISGGKAVATAAGELTRIYQTITTVAGRWYKVTFTCSTRANGIFSLRFAGTQYGVTRNAAGTYTEYFLATGSSTEIAIIQRPSSAPDDVLDATFDDYVTVHIAGNHRYQATAASRPILRQSGIFYYLEYDGTDDGMVTNAIDFSGSGKLTVWAGLRKASDAARGMFVELSAVAGGGDFYFAAPDSAATNFGVGLYGAGTNTGYQPTPHAAPTTKVVSIALDFAGASRAANVAIRINQALDQTGGFGETTGVDASAFTNDALYFGRRGGSTLPFNGREYGTIIRGGASDSATIYRAEAWLNGKTGAF